MPTHCKFANLSLMALRNEYRRQRPSAAAGITAIAWYIRRIRSSRSFPRHQTMLAHGTNLEGCGWRQRLM